MTKTNISLSKKNFIIDGFQKMNLSMLEVTLDDDKTYQNESKIDFLKKIEKAFDKFKQNGNTELKAHKFVCEVSYEFSTTFQGYSFVGNNSKKTLILIFEETETNVENIYDCNGMEISDLLSTIYQTADCSITNAEKINEISAIDYLVLSQKCMAAVTEIQHFENKIINKTIYLSWLDKYHVLNKSLQNTTFDCGGFRRFTSLYENLNHFRKILEENINAKNAIEEYEKILPDDENKLLKWLVANEEMYNKCYSMYYLDDDFTNCFDEDIDEDIDEDLEFYRLYDSKIKIDLIDFKFVLQFLEYFEFPHQEYLAKYTTFTIEQQNEYHNDSSHPLWDAVYSLKYHLQQRGLL
ncbi:hypothetical protein [Flavobacterium sp.]|uniref:hypothetical protein n=1 Tax=Flavobacterium sp. TaxID=239 RepID=UPI0037536325